MPHRYLGADTSLQELIRDSNEGLYGQKASKTLLIRKKEMFRFQESQRMDTRPVQSVLWADNEI